MRCEYKAALIGGIPLGIIMLGCLVMVSPSRQLEILFLLLCGGIGGLLTYVCYKTSHTDLSLTKATIVGASVGVTAGVLYSTCGAIIYLVAVNSSVVLNSRNMSLAILAVAQLAVVSGLGGLTVGFVLQLWRRSYAVPKNSDQRRS